MCFFILIKMNNKTREINEDLILYPSKHKEFKKGSFYYD